MGSLATTTLFAKVVILTKVLVFAVAAIGGLGITTSFVYGSLGIAMNDTSSKQKVVDGT